MLLNISSLMLKISTILLPKCWATSTWAKARAACRPKPLSFWDTRDRGCTCETLRHQPSRFRLAKPSLKMAPRSSQRPSYLNLG